MLAGTQHCLPRWDVFWPPWVDVSVSLRNLRTSEDRLFISDSWARAGGAFQSRVLFCYLLLPLFPSVHVRIGVISRAVGTLVLLRKACYGV